MTNPLYDHLFSPHVGKNTTFLILPNGQKISHSAFLAMAARYANAFDQLGLTFGDRVAVQVAKSPEALALYAACVQAGLVFLPLNTGYTVSEVEYFVSDSGARLLVCDPEAALALKSAIPSVQIETIDAHGLGTLSETATTQPDIYQTKPRRSEDLAALLYTSGTTGRSKGAMLTHDNLLSNAESLVECWQFTDQDVLLHALPIFHSHGLFVASNVSLLAGGSMIFLPKFEIDLVLRWLSKATSMMGVPTFYTRLLDDPNFAREVAKHMRLFISGSAPLLADTHEQFEARTGQRILERYGMTETSMNTTNPYDSERRAGTVGFALPRVELKITDPATGAPVPNGEIGQIEVRGPNVFKGYWGMPDKTREEIRSDGFFITGDLAKFDEDRYIHIVGRNKDLIISGGYNIYPKEVELFLDEQSGVLESAVIGVPHPDFGEAVVAVLVGQPGEDINPDILRAAAMEKLAKFKQPKHFEVVPELPRNSMGKVQKNLLRDQFSRLFQS